jgi:hypothetical protein
MVENVKNIKIAKNLLNIKFSPFSSLTDRLTGGQTSSNVGGDFYYEGEFLGMLK